MTKTLKHIFHILLILGVIVVGWWCITAFNGAVDLEPATPPPMVEAEHTTLFDTNYLNDWCCGCQTSTTYMVGAEFHHYTENGTCLVDQTGTLWEVNIHCNELDYFLLWLDDNNTPEREDDIVAKLWAEVHE